MINLQLQVSEDLHSDQKNIFKRIRTSIWNSCNYFKRTAEISAYIQKGIFLPSYDNAIVNGYLYAYDELVYDES